MRRPGAAAGRGLVVGAAALALLGAGAVVRSAPQDRGVPAGRPALAARAAGGPGTAVALQARLDRVPGDWRGWAALGDAYVEQARTSSDPALYERAEAAVARSLSIRPAGNAEALTARAALAAARHDFAAARRDATAARRLNPYSAPALGVLVDALIELGEYDAAFASVQRLVDLRPELASYTRVSYAFELRGDQDGAAYALGRALDVAVAPADVAFVRLYLGELAWERGDAVAAARHYDAGLRADPDAPLLRAGRARALAAAGDTAAARREYEAVLDRVPLAEIATEYVDLLTSLGDDAAAGRQGEFVRTAQRLQAGAGADPGLEVALFEASFGSPAKAVAAARGELARRRSVHVEDAYAWALHAAGRDREALPHARRALRLGTRSAAFHFHLGMIEAALGQDAAARRSLRTALRLNPRFSPTGAAAARRTLARLR